MPANTGCARPMPSAAPRRPPPRSWCSRPSRSCGSASFSRRTTAVCAMQTASATIGSRFTIPRPPPQAPRAGSSPTTRRCLQNGPSRRSRSRPAAISSSSPPRKTVPSPTQSCTPVSRFRMRRAATSRSSARTTRRQPLSHRIRRNTPTSPTASRARERRSIFASRRPERQTWTASRQCVPCPRSHRLRARLARRSMYRSRARWRAARCATRSTASHRLSIRPPTRRHSRSAPRRRCGPRSCFPANATARARPRRICGSGRT